MDWRRKQEIDARLWGHWRWHGGWARATAAANRYSKI